MDKFYNEKGKFMQINGLNRLTTDVLIIGGGTAGCYAALTIRKSQMLQL